MARKKQSLLNSSMILVASAVICKVIGLLYKIPITKTIGLAGLGIFEAAYNVYIPIYSIALAGLPVAVSRMVAHYAASGRIRDVRRVQRIAFRLFMITGLAGFGALILLAYPYAWLVKNPPLALLIIAIAPSVLACALMSTYRGYYNGLRNMYPTAISEVIETLVKAAFGIVLAKLVVNYAMAQFHAGKAVFGKIVVDEAAVLEQTAPYSALAAIVGVTISTLFALLYLVLRHRLKGDGITRDELRAAPRPENPKDVAKKIITIATPIVLSSLIFNLISLIDATTLLNRLESVVMNNPDVMQSMYPNAFASTTLALLKDCLYGAYSIAQNFRNLLPTLTITIGTSAIPVLAEGWTLKNKGMIQGAIESVTRITMLLALPMGIGMAVLPEQILLMLYNKAAVEPGLAVSVPSMVAFGLSAPLIAFAQPTTSMLQGLGRTDIPLYSTTIGAVLKIAVNYSLISVPGINIFGAVISTIVCYTVMVVVNTFFLLRITRVRLNWGQIFIKPLICSLLCGGAAWLSYSGLSHALRPRIATLAAVCLAGFVYALALLYTRAITKREIHMLPKGKKIAAVLEKYKLIG